MGSKSLRDDCTNDTSINLTMDETSVNISEIMSEPSASFLDPEQSFSRQQDLYGSICPSPLKPVKNVSGLPKLNEKLILPKQRKRSNSMDAKFYKTRENGNTKQIKRPSTCGKEGLRNFSTPLPQKIESLNDSPFPTLTPDQDDVKIENTTGSNTPLLTKNKTTSPLSLRCFSTPLADVRSKSMASTAVQIKLNQLSSKKFLEEQERQLEREITKYTSEINLMKKIKKYRETNDTQKLNELIEKWRDIAQKGSNYLFNAAKLKISRMGGIEEFRKRQKKSKLKKMKFEFDESLLFRIEEYMETEEFKNLEGYEKEEVLSRKKELEEMSEKLENGQIAFGDEEEEDDDDDEFTIEELYKQLGLDYELVYNS